MISWPLHRCELEHEEVELVARDDPRAAQPFDWTSADGGYLVLAAVLKGMDRAEVERLAGWRSEGGRFIGHATPSALIQAATSTNGGMELARAGD